MRELKESLPFELTADGEVIAMVTDVHNLEDKPEASHDVHKLAELPFSKSRQASSLIR